MWELDYDKEINIMKKRGSQRNIPNISANYNFSLHDTRKYRKKCIQASFVLRTSQTKRSNNSIIG